MGFLDRFRTLLAPKSTRTSGVVPPRHQVGLYSASNARGVERARGGAVIVAVDSLDQLASSLAQALPLCAESPVLLATGAASLHALMASDASSEAVPGLLVLVLQDRALDELAQGPEPVLVLLRGLGALLDRKLRLSTVVALTAVSSLGSTIAASLLASLQLRVQLPSREEVILTEVVRPDGSIVTALTGQRHPDLPDAIDEFWRPSLQRHAAASDAVTRANLERAQLSQAGKVIEASREALIRRTRQVPRAPALRRALRDVAQGKPDAERRLFSELLYERSALLLLSRQNAEGGWDLAPRSWPGQSPHYAAYPDEEWALRAADEMGLTQGTYALASMSVRRLAGWAFEQEAGVALAVYLDEGVGYVPLGRDALVALAQGKNPGDERV